MSINADKGDHQERKKKKHVNGLEFDVFNRILRRSSFEIFVFHSNKIVFEFIKQFLLNFAQTSYRLLSHIIPENRNTQLFIRI